MPASMWDSGIIVHRSSANILSYEPTIKWHAHTREACTCWVNIYENTAINDSSEWTQTCVTYVRTRGAGYSFIPGWFSQKASRLLYALYRFTVTSVMVTSLSIHLIIIVTWDHSIFNKQLISYRLETVCGLTENRTWTVSKIPSQLTSWNDDVFMNYIIQAVIETVHVFIFYSLVRIFAGCFSPFFCVFHLLHLLLLLLWLTLILHPIPRPPLQCKCN